MDLTAQRRLITASTAGFLAVAAAGVVWSLAGIDPPARQSDSTRGSKRGINLPVDPPQPATVQQAARVDLALKLQQPLYDPPKPPPPKPQPKPDPKPVVVRNPPAVKAARLDWTLSGTIIDSDQSVAILTDASGKTDIRAAGEVVELSPPGVLVRKIDSEKVTLEVRGTESTLRLKSSFQSSGGGRPDRPNRRPSR
ncbi:hypothetical protein Enr13x_01210 [Stieleria neptunia]|uniref:Type II secretion system protein GspC N-terminal domain-containing protein n=1 Tax=Stieleria neptunia TaxID=2527979 RepID=A0A518HHI7_9BACT|nr:hypothetical protein [Stieleria neptunia]QDV40315.1 hypothetical protein Enr13x_01210 [Stieleria neptunia]